MHDSQPYAPFDPAHPNVVPYDLARCEIRNGDLLFWTPTNFFASLIARYTDGPFSHVGSASWSGGVLESHEMLQFYGGRTVNLSALVRAYPSQIHVHRVPHVHGRMLAECQRRRAGEPYGWMDIARIAGRTLTQDMIRSGSRCRLEDVSKTAEFALWELLYRVPLDEPAFCSEAVVSDLRRAGVDAFSALAAWEVSPNMLAMAADYLFTLG